MVFYSAIFYVTKLRILVLAVTWLCCDWSAGMFTELIVSPRPRSIHIYKIASK